MSTAPVGPLTAQFLPLSILRTVWKNWPWIISVSGITVLISCGIVYRLPAIYRAETLILVESQKIPEKLVSSTVNAELQDRIATISQEVLSATRLQTLIDKFGLYRDERKTHVQEEIIDLMRKDMNIKLERGWTRNQPGAFRVTYQGTSPETVAAVVNQIGNFFIDENLKAREEQAAGTSEFIKAQLDEAKKGLEDQERKLSEYKLQHQGELPQQENSILAALASLHVQFQGNQDATARAQSNKLMLDTTLAAAEASLTGVMNLNNQLTSNIQTPHDHTQTPPETKHRESDSLRAKVESLQARYTDSYPELKESRLLLDEAIQSEFKATSDALQKLPSQSADRPSIADHSLRQVVESTPEMRVAQERVASLRGQAAAAAKELEDRQADGQRILTEITSYQSRVEKLPVREQEMAGILRDYQISKANYEQLLGKNLAAEMATDMEKRQKAERFTVLDVARTPEKPFKPNRPAFYAAGVLLGVMLGAGAAFIREFKRNVVMGEWELPADLTILGRVETISFPDSVSK
jgi:succinoglycan biosynthesis transport protein ExoP